MSFLATVVSPLFGTIFPELSDTAPAIQSTV